MSVQKLLVWLWLKFRSTFEVLIERETTFRFDFTVCKGKRRAEWKLRRPRRSATSPSCRHSRKGPWPWGRSGCVTFWRHVWRFLWWSRRPRLPLPPPRARLAVEATLANLKQKMLKRIRIGIWKCRIVQENENNIRCKQRVRGGNNTRSRSFRKVVNKKN